MLQRPWKDRPVMVWLTTTVLLLAFTTTEVSCWKYVYFSSKPNTTIYTDIGRNVSMKWSFRVEENGPYKKGVPFELMFGDWNYHGYISPTIVRIKGSVIRKMNDKVHWRGNISNYCERSNCEGEITLFNLTSGDFKTYGIYIMGRRHSVFLHQVLRIVRQSDDATTSSSLSTTEFKTLDSKGVRTRGQPIKVVYLVIGCYTVTNIYFKLMTWFP